MIIVDQQCSETEEIIPRSTISVRLNLERHDEVWRLAAYSLENCLLDLQSLQLKLYNLGPLDLMIFNVVAVASLQKTIRGVGRFNELTTDVVPTNESNGTISRRRISEATGIARATVARSLQRLTALSLVVERGRGQLQVPVGIVLKGKFARHPADLYAPVLNLFEQFIRLGLVNLEVTDPRSVRSLVDFVDPVVGAGRPHYNSRGQKK